jgi:tetratricopeptide (TPR) repeat protein
MEEHPSRLKAFLTELKRRKVYRVAAAYAAGAFVVWQAAEIALPALGFPGSVLRFVVVISLLGFPVAVVLAWIYELRPELRVSRDPSHHPSRLGWWPVLAAGLVVAGTALVAYILLRVEGDARDETRLAIFPLHSRSPGGESLGEGVADLIAVGVDGTPGITVVDPRALWPPVLMASASPLADLDENRLAETSRRFDASHFVTGTVLDAGGSLQVALRIHESEDAAAIASVRASAPSDSVGPLVDQLAVDLVASLWRDDAIPAVGRVDQHATSSPQALGAYLEAMAHARRGRFDEATEAIERAVAADSTFALAHLEHFRIRGWVLSLNNQPKVGLREIIDRAMAFRDRLTPRNRLRVEAARALDDTDAATSAMLNERIIEIDSSDADAWASLAIIQTQDGWMLHRRFEDVRPTVERALELDSLNVPLLYALGLHHLLAGDTAAAAAAGTHLDRVNPEGPIPEGFRAGLSVLTAPEPALDSVIRAVSRQPAGPVIGALRITRLVDLDRSLRLAEFLRDSAGQVMHRQLGFGAALQISAALGQASRIDSMVHAPTVDPVLRSYVHRYLVAMALAGAGDREMARHAAEQLVPFAPLDSLAWAVETQIDAFAAAWAIGAFHASIGDTARARAYRDALLALGPMESTVPLWAESVAADLEARLAVRRGDEEAALAAAMRAYELWIIHDPSEGGWFPEPGIRFHLARRLDAAGRREDAAWLYRSFLTPHWTSFYTVRAQEALAVDPAGASER